MSGNSWIIIGIIAAAFAAFAIPYGFYKKTKEDGTGAATIAGDYIAGDKVINVVLSDAASEKIVRQVAQESREELTKKYPQAYTVFGIKQDGLVVPKGFIPDNLKIFWESGEVHSISDTTILITLPDMILNERMRICRNYTPLAKKVGSKSGRLISIGGISPRVEILGIHDDLIVVALGFEEIKETK